MTSASFSPVQAKFVGGLGAEYGWLGRAIRLAWARNTGKGRNLGCGIRKVGVRNTEIQGMGFYFFPFDWEKIQKSRQYDRLLSDMSWDAAMWPKARACGLNLGHAASWGNSASRVFAYYFFDFCFRAPS